MKKVEILYHGSPYKMKTIRPKNLHGDTSVDDAVFATPHREFAAAYIGKKWGDRDFDQSIYRKNKNEKPVHVLEEMRPGAFDDIFKGRKGYLYHLNPEDFSKEKTLGSKSEVISRKPVVPLKAEFIQDALKHLKRQGVVLKEFDPDSKSHKQVIERRIRRLNTMAPDVRKGYLAWIEEKNPLYAAKLKEGGFMKKAFWLGFEKRAAPLKSMSKVIRNMSFRSPQQIHETANIRGVLEGFDQLSKANPAGVKRSYDRGMSWIKRNKHLLKPALEEMEPETVRKFKTMDGLHGVKKK